MIRIAPLTVLLALSPLATSAQAAEQGSIAASSKGEIAISVTVAGRATLSDAAAASDTPGTMRAACVWLDTATQRYALTVLDGGVRWRAPGAAAIPTAIRSGTTLPGLIATATHPDCDHDAAHLAAYATTRADPAAPTTLLVAPE